MSQQYNWPVNSSIIDQKSCIPSYIRHFSIFLLQIFRIIVEVQGTHDYQKRLSSWTCQKMWRKSFKIRPLNFSISLAKCFWGPKFKICPHSKKTCRFTLKSRSKNIENSPRYLCVLLKNWHVNYLLMLDTAILKIYRLAKVLIF